MNLQEKYEQVIALIKKVDFNKIWPGFYPLPFALYNESECFLAGQYIEKTDEFIANTAIEYQGEVIAIWQLQEDINLEILASKLIHEMFHGFQMLNHESRFPAEMAALYQYQYTNNNLAIKMQENKLLVQMCQKFDMKLFEEFLGLRQYRSTHFPQEFAYEAAIEQIEGTAEYVSLSVLSQLESSHYATEYQKMQKRIVDYHNFMPIRIISYDIGALLIHTMRTNGIAFDMQFTPLTFNHCLLENVKALDPDHLDDVQPLIDEHFAAANAIIMKALAENIVIATGEFELLSVNIYDAVYYNDYITSRYFVMYRDATNPEAEAEVAYGDFVIAMNKEKKAIKIYKMANK